LDFSPTLTPGHGPRTDDEMSLGFIGYAVAVDAKTSTEGEN
jgi:hypothetical protein